MGFDVVYDSFGFFKLRKVTRVVNKDCPYGYSFCFERKQAKDRRYIQEWRCNWVCVENELSEFWFCQEIESMAGKG